MGDKYFRPAGDLSDVSDSKTMYQDSNYFKMPGDLSENKSDLIYSRAKDLDLTPYRESEEIGNYFRPAGDLNTELIDCNKELIMNKNEIDDYLLAVVSGKKYDGVCELGVLMESGRIIVGLKQLVQMVDEGYNIVSAKVLNDTADIIEVEFQKYVYDEEKMEKWRRF